MSNGFYLSSRSDPSAKSQSGHYWLSFETKLFWHLIQNVSFFFLFIKLNVVVFNEYNMARDARVLRHSMLGPESKTHGNIFFLFTPQSSWFKSDKSTVQDTFI